MKYRASIQINKPLFDELDINKENLIHWLEFYKGIYELERSERPRDEIIADDFLLDDWVERYIQKQKSRSKRRDHKEVIEIE